MPHFSPKPLRPVNQTRDALMPAHTSPGSAAAVRAVAAYVPDPAALDRPVLVAVDGGDGVGKTWFADALAHHLASRVGPSPGPVPREGYAVVRASIDDFHHPRAYRHAIGRTGRTVWERSFDVAAVRRELLDPWRSGAGAAYRTRWHDLASDAFIDEPPERVPERGVLVFDGVFAQRPELRDAWDLVVYVDAPDEVRVARMAVRDGGSPDLTHPDQARYLDAQRFYRELVDPRARADLVVDNTDLAHPTVLRNAARHT